MTIAQALGPPDDPLGAFCRENHVSLEAEQVQQTGDYLDELLSINEAYLSETFHQVPMAGGGNLADFVERNLPNYAQYISIEKSPQELDPSSEEGDKQRGDRKHKSWLRNLKQLMK